MTVEVRIEDIVVEDRMFGLKEHVVTALMESIDESGVIEPIVVRRLKGGKLKLVAGRHRYVACCRLKWTKVPVTFRTEAKANRDDDDLAQIDENLIRLKLTPTEEAQAMKRRKEIYEARHPETKNGGDRRSSGRQRGDLNRFTQDTARKTGRSERAIQRSVRRAAMLGTPTLGKIKGTALDSAKELDALVEMPEAERAALIERAAAGERVTAIITQVAANTAAPVAMGLKRLNAAWKAANPADRAAFCRLRGLTMTEEQAS